MFSTRLVQLLFVLGVIVLVGTIWFLVSSKPVVDQSLTNLVPPTLAAKDVHPFGSAPGLKYKLISEQLPRRYVLIFSKGDDVISGLITFAAKEKLHGANFSAIGGLEQSAVAFFDRRKSVYKTIYIDKQAELVSMTGSISFKEEKYVAHAHGVVALSDGKTIGGHFLYAKVWPTVELFLTESDQKIERSIDAETGLWLIKP